MMLNDEKKKKKVVDHIEKTHLDKNRATMERRVKKEEVLK